MDKMDKKELGRMGENLAAKYLKGQSYQILERNWQFGRYEVDIIAKDNENLVIIEVKTRNTDVFGHPASFVSKQQQLNLAEAVEAYLTDYPERYLPVRYDVISVILNQYTNSIEHFTDAFWPDNLGLSSQDF